MFSFDVIVAGVGAMGSATCLHLARRGARVLGLDRYGIPNALGSSHGESRVIRLCYYEHPDYVPLLRRAHEAWDDIERDAGLPLKQLTGGLYLGPPDSAFVSGTLRAAREHDLPHEVIEAGALPTRFEQFRVPDDFLGVYEPNAGVLHVERCVQAMVTQAAAAGAELHGHEPLLDWSCDDDGVTVSTSRVGVATTYRARHLVLCAGAWTGPLLHDAGVDLVPTRQLLGWVWPRRPDLFTADRFPIWGIDDVDGYFHYGFPMLPGGAGLKLARHHLGEPADPETIERDVVAGDDADIRRAVERHLPDAAGPVLSLAVCMYTNTPDGHFVLDRHPSAERVRVAAGFSGHGFKFAPVIGEALADAILDGGTELPVEFLGLGRFREGRVVADCRSAAPESGR